MAEKVGLIQMDRDRFTDPTAELDVVKHNIVAIASVIEAGPYLQAKVAELSTLDAQVIKADSGYDGLSSVTVPEVTAAVDANIVPDNIKKDVTILGVVGDYAGSGGVVAASPRLIYKELTSTGWVDTVVQTLIPGDVIALKAGSDVAEGNVGLNSYVPAMEFQEWSCALPISNNTITVPDWLVSDLYVGGIYTAVDGSDHFIYVVTEGGSSSTVSFNCYGTAAGTTYIDWGDGVTDTSTVTVATAVTHTYSSYGVYHVKVSTSTPERKSMYLFNKSTYASSIGLVGAYLSNITTVGDSVFNNCYSLTSISLPVGVTSVGDNVFQSCSSLTSISLPVGVTTVGNLAFESCFSLTSVSLPAGVTTVGDNVFQSCSSLVVITMSSAVPPTLSASFTPDNKSLRIYVPEGSVAAYKAATNWAALSSYILADTPAMRAQYGDI